MDIKKEMKREKISITTYQRIYNEYIMGAPEEQTNTMEPES